MQAKVFHLMKKLVHVFQSACLRFINQYNKENPTCKNMKYPTCKNMGSHKICKLYYLSQSRITGTANNILISYKTVD